MFRPFRSLLLLGIAIVTILLSWLNTIEPARSLDFMPPDRGAPQRVDAGGARYSDFEVPGDREIPIVVNGEELECPLTAIVPVENYGLTFQEYPTIYVHVPDVPGAEVTFALRDDDDRIVYQSRFTLGHRHGTFGIALPAHANFDPLEVYRPYRWTLELEEYSERVSGVIVRVLPTETFARQLDRATPRERLALYAETGIWYDAIDTLAELHRADPENEEFIQIWQEITKSVDLMKVGEKTLL